MYLVSVLNYRLFGRTYKLFVNENSKVVRQRNEGKKLLRFQREVNLTFSKLAVTAGVSRYTGIKQVSSVNYIYCCNTCISYRKQHLFLSPK